MCYFGYRSKKYPTRPPTDRLTITATISRVNTALEIRLPRSLYISRFLLGDYFDRPQNIILKIIPNTAAIMNRKSRGSLNIQVKYIIFRIKSFILSIDHLCCLICVFQLNIRSIKVKHNIVWFNTNLCIHTRTYKITSSISTLWNQSCLKYQLINLIL